MSDALNTKFAEWICDNTKDCRVADVLVGLAYTKVVLADQRSGIAYSFAHECSRGCCPLGSNEPLAGRRALELVGGLSSKRQLERSIALATINALRNDHYKEKHAADVLSTDLIRGSDNVAMVGYFGPLVEPLKKRCNRLYVFDKDLSKAKELTPIVDMPEFLQRCDVALVTSTSIANGSAEEILASANNCREIVLLGASTPLVPDFFRQYKVTMLAGIVVTDKDALDLAIKEGRGMRHFKKSIKKINVLVEP